MKKCVGIIESFIAILFIAVFFLFQNPNASATTSTITLNITDSISVNVLPSDNGTFASSTATNNVSIKTDSASGYELGIKASTSGSNNNALINTTDSSKTIPSITTSISEADYSSSSSHNNTWGLKPSKLNSQANSNYIPGPSSNTNLTVIDKTTTANPTTFNNYTITLGTRIDNTQAPGSYANTFVITAVANPTPYTITYNKNTTDTVTNMPANTSSQTYDEKVNISNQVPARDGFNFKGWCTAQTADGGTCTGTTYNPDGGGTALTWTLDQTISSNSLAIYAMWEQAITLQDMTFADCPTDTAKSISDARDGESYKVQVLADGKCWMLDNLRLDLSNSTVLNNTTGDNTNASTTTLNYLKNGGGSTSDRYPTAKINNVPWTSDSQNYYSVPMTISTYKDQTTTSYGEGSGKIGVYYNYCAASAGNYCFGDGTSQGSPSGNATEDICPKGWRMPTGDSSGEYQALYTAYSSDRASFKNALSSPLSGYFSHGSALSQGTDGTFWSSTYDNEYRMSNLYVANTATSLSQEVEPAYRTARFQGISVRCVKTSHPTLYDLVAKQSKGTQDVTALRTAITMENSGVYEYNSSVFGTASDAANTSKIYYYRGILDNTTGSYGSDGDNAAWPNTVLLDTTSNGKDTSDTCWRIVRTTGSGGVKMIYQGKWTGSTCTNSSANANAVSDVYFNRRSTSDKNQYGTKGRIIYLGYNFSSNSSHQTDTSSVNNSTLLVNGTQSNLRTQLESWYNSNMTAWTSKLETSAGWCNDRTTYSSKYPSDKITSNVPYKTSSATANFGPYIRNVTTNSQPTLGCPNDTGYDLLTTSNGYIGVPSAPLTADEVAFAGSGYDSSTTPYHANSFLRSGDDFWLLSPSFRNPNGPLYEFYLTSDGSLYRYYVSSAYGVRPSISLKAGSEAVSGSGTAADPWIVNP